jgi:uncharacterized phage-associated protein
MSYLGLESQPEFRDHDSLACQVSTRFFHTNHYIGAMHDSRTIANFLLKKADVSGNPLTPMQLLKLVYIAHGWNLGFYGRPLIRDEVQAWQYGPVIPRLYNKVKDFRDQPVKGPLLADTVDTMTEIDRDLLDQVWHVYGEMSGPALSRLTHAPGTPWALTYKPGKWGIRIPNDLIEDHYRKLAAERA